MQPGDAARLESQPQGMFASSLLMGTQFPPLDVFRGRGDTPFDEWIEQFEMVASAYGWNDHMKLVNLTTRLREQAYAFLRSCTSQQRTSYPSLTQALKARFTPVKIKAVESSRFHERKQKEGEPVDEYAQSLRVLFHRAYPASEQGSREAEDLGRSILSYQFVAGLTPPVKLKIAGMAGTGIWTSC